jgi:hypothetical protein
MLSAFVEQPALFGWDQIQHRAPVAGQLYPLPALPDVIGQIAE